MKMDKHIRDGCRFFHERRCRSVLTRIERELEAANLGAWRGQRHLADCSEAKKLVKEAGSPDTGSCNHAELDFETKVPNPLLLRYEEHTVRVREACGD